MKAVETPAVAARRGGDAEDDAPPVRAAIEPSGPGRPPDADAPAPARADAADPARRARGGDRKPSTGNAPEDEYLYGYRLWAAKLYPEAETQLKKVADAYPKHRRASYARTCSAAPIWTRASRASHR